MDPRQKYAAQFHHYLDGYQLCGQRLTRLKYEVARAVAMTPAHHTQLKEVLRHYLEETSRLRAEKAKLGHDVSRLDGVLKVGLTDRYVGPLLHGRYKIFEALAPAGKYYLVDYADADLICSGTEEFTRLDSLAQAQQAVEALHKLHPQGVSELSKEPKPRMSAAPNGKPQPAFLKPEAEKAPAAKVAKPAKVKAEVTADRQRPASAMFKELIMAGKLTDDQIFEAVQKEYGLDDGKRSYVKWYRNDLQKKGQNPPGPVGGATASTTVKLPKQAGLGGAVDLDKAEKPVTRKSASLDKSPLGAVVQKVRKEEKAKRSAAAAA